MTDLDDQKRTMTSCMLMVRDVLGKFAAQIYKTGRRWSGRVGLPVETVLIHGKLKFVNEKV